MFASSNETRRRSSAKLLTRDEARRVAVNIAKLAGAVVLGMNYRRLPLCQPPERAEALSSPTQ
jgi:hypothetical protein